MNDPNESLVSFSEGDILSEKYRIGRALGSGSIGHVFCARNLLLDRDVAIKFLRAEHQENDDIVERFLREARTANRVRHPHVVGTLVSTMEFLTLSKNC
jgi:eukaryotic-like serine/threonine-protein kinase